jgi:hypothetical protein
LLPRNPVAAFQNMCDGGDQNHHGFRAARVGPTKPTTFRAASTSSDELRGR